MLASSSSDAFNGGYRFDRGFLEILSSAMFTNVIPTKLYKFRTPQRGSGVPGDPQPSLLPHIGTSLVRRATEDEEDDDDADRARRGDTVDAFGFTVSARVQQGAPWKRRHDQFADRIVQMMQFNGMKARAEPKNVVNRRPTTAPERRHAGWPGPLAPKAPRRHPRVAYTDPRDGKEKIAELRFIMGPSRYDCPRATSLRAAVTKLA